MNGGHDLGGMHGLGPIGPEADEPVFHQEWERRVLALTLAAGALGQWTIDMSRHARERQHPADYLRHSYYENWLVGLEKLLVEKGLLSAEELADGKARMPLPPGLAARALEAADVAAVLAKGGPADADVDEAPRFAAGDRVRVINRHPLGHTRAPRYVRGRSGVIHEHVGGHVLPDLSAQGIRKGAHLYNVRFAAEELWGESAATPSVVHVDLWQDYLEGA